MQLSNFLFLVSTVRFLSRNNFKILTKVRLKLCFYGSNLWSTKIKPIFRKKKKKLKQFEKKEIFIDVRATEFSLSIIMIYDRRP